MSAFPQPHWPTLQVERPEDAAAVDRLVDRVFGPGRFTKVSERVREFARFRPDLSFCARNGERLAGAVRQWDVHVGDRAAIFLGPLAVDETQRLAGLGGQLVEQACAAAKAAGSAAVVLVGDLAYFSRFGFAAAPGIVMPGPVDPRRVLVRPLTADPQRWVGPLRA